MFKLVVAIVILVVLIMTMAQVIGTQNKSTPSAFNNPKTINQVLNSKSTKVFPEADDPKDNIGLGYFTSFEGKTYFLKEVSKSRWMWVVDDAAESTLKKEQEESAKIRLKLEQDKRDLVWALRTRPLTDDEMKRVKDQGDFLLTPIGVQYNPESIRKEFNDLLLNQYLMKLEAQKLEIQKLKFTVCIGQTPTPVNP